MYAGAGGARLAATAAALVLVTTGLQGCGNDKPGPTPAPETTTTVTTTQMGPMPPQPETPFKPLRGVCYQAPPGKMLSPQLPGLDMLQAGYASQWGSGGRDDLGMIRTLGGNAVRVYHAAGVDVDDDHGAFLDRAHELGLHVLLGFHTQNVCPDFDCFPHWKQAAASGIKVGFAKDGKWHPAIKVVVLMDEPDNLNLLTPDGLPVNCTGQGYSEAECRTKAALSAMEGFLAAEDEAGLDGSNVSLTVAWSFAERDSIDEKVIASETYGFQDMAAGVEDPSRAEYEARDWEGLQSAYASRWVNSVNVPSSWTFAKEKIADQYGAFESHPWFIAQLTPTTDGLQDLTQDLMDIEAETQKPSSKLLGVAFNTFQKDYQRDEPSVEGLFGLGSAEFGKAKPCQEDVIHPSKLCAEYPIYCLDAGAGQYAAEVAAAWGGSLSAHGACPAGPAEAAEEEVAEEADEPSLVV